MRNRFKHLGPVWKYLGALSWFFAAVVLVPVPVDWWFAGGNSAAFVCTSAVFVILGLVLARRPRFPALTTRQSMLVCSLGWLLVSAVSAIPFWVALSGGNGSGWEWYLDCVFETVSGFTTTGITMLSGLDGMPRGVLFWRALIQWLGGLGILSFFMLIFFAGGTPHHLIGAEAHKISSPRANPSMWSTLKILWLVYAGLTAACTLLLVIEGLSLYDAVYHAFTGLSTGGFSPYDASIGHYAANPAVYPRWRLIEYTVAFFMLLGGMNFIVHYRVATGGVAALWDNFEVRLWWLIIAASTALVMFSHMRSLGPGNYEDGFRTSLFQTISIATTTGFATRDIGGPMGTVYFGAAAQQVFLILMVVGGCVGSTGGGIKVLRIGVLYEALKRQARRVVVGSSATNMVVIDGHPVDNEEIRRTAALFFGWIALLVVGGLVTAAFSAHGPLEALSGSFSAMGNIGPCYIATPEMSDLHWVVKIVYIFQMLAGRLEILPMLILFSPRTWR